MNQEEFTPSDRELFDLERVEAWVREAVCDQDLAAHIFERSRVAIKPEVESGVASGAERALRLGLALHYIRALSGRHLLSCVSAALISEEGEEGEGDEEGRVCWLERANPLWERTRTGAVSSDRLKREARRDGVSNFAPIQSVYARPTLGMSALDLIADLAPPLHPAKRDAQRYVALYLSSIESQLRTTAGSKELSATGSKEEQVGQVSSESARALRAWLWDHLDAREELTPLLAHAARCLDERPERADELAVRLALLQPDQAPAVCEALITLSPTVKARFSARLEKQLKRVRRIKLWVQCRELLSKDA